MHQLDDGRRRLAEIPRRHAFLPAPAPPIRRFLAAAADELTQAFHRRVRAVEGLLLPAGSGDLRRHIYMLSLIN